MMPLFDYQCLLDTAVKPYHENASALATDDTLGGHLTPKILHVQRTHLLPHMCPSSSRHSSSRWLKPPKSPLAHSSSLVDTGGRVRKIKQRGPDNSPVLTRVMCVCIRLFCELLVAVYGSNLAIRSAYICQLTHRVPIKF